MKSFKIQMNWAFPETFNEDKVLISKIRLGDQLDVRIDVGRNFFQIPKLGIRGKLNSRFRRIMNYSIFLDEEFKDLNQDPDELDSMIRLGEFLDRIK